jgi:Methyltransferase domain
VTTFYSNITVGLKGLEIGGPSSAINNIGVYNVVESLDNAVWSEKTVWHRGLTEFRFGNGPRRGKLFYCDGTDLNLIADASYELVISCHSLEHMANPLKALREFDRVLVPGGIVMIVVPRKESCFDHNRATTLFEHVLDDYAKNTGEDDMTHLAEILRDHDLELDPFTKNFEDFTRRSLDNINNRCLHHHVFDELLLNQIFKWLEYSVLRIETTDPEYFAVGKKPL